MPRDGRAVQVWLPVPSIDEPSWSRPGDTWFESDAPEARLDEVGGARFVHARWPAGTGTARIDVFFHAATRSRAVELGTPDPSQTLTAAEMARHTAPTELIPTDGIVHETAARITAGALPA